MKEHNKNDPLHGVTLEAILNQLVDHYGWEGLASRININCFKSDPSIKSSLKFLRRTPWARTKVEELFVGTFHSASKYSASKHSASKPNPWGK